MIDMIKKAAGAAKSRYTILSFILILSSLFMFVRLFELQIIKGVQYVQSSPIAGDTRRVLEVAPRGRIMDRNGVPIATNSEIYTAHIIRSGKFNGENGEAELNRVLFELGCILEKNNDTYLHSIERYMRFVNGKPEFVKADLNETAARSILGSFLFTGDDVAKPARVLSGGEKTRLALAKLVVSAANVLLLDEPTNNLDPASRGEVLAAIAAYEGAIVLVTHDEGAVEALNPDRVLVLPDGTEDLWNPEYAELISLA